MSSGLAIRALRPGEMQKALPLLNEEFIILRGRRLLLQERYRELFAAANSGSCFAAFSENGTILSFAATEGRQLKDPALKIFFVGCVCTALSARGQGLAGKVLTFAAETCRAKGFAAGYLWTRLNKFYERLGWKASDRSILMTLRNVEPGDAQGILTFSEKDAEASAKAYPGLLIRRASDYDKVPPPADVPVRMKTVGGSCLLGGIGQSAGYIYELCAESREDLSALLSAFAARCGDRKEIWINLQPEQQSEIGLLKSCFPDAETSAPSLQMNLIFAEEHRPLLEGLNIPYLDRI